MGKLSRCCSLPARVGPSLNPAVPGTVAVGETRKSQSVRAVPIIRILRTAVTVGAVDCYRPVAARRTVEQTSGSVSTLPEITR